MIECVVLGTLVRALGVIVPVLVLLYLSLMSRAVLELSRRRRLEGWEEACPPHLVSASQCHPGLLQVAKEPAPADRALGRLDLHAQRAFSGHCRP